MRACEGGKGEVVRYMVEEVRAEHRVVSAKDENCMHAAVKSRNISVV